jgi:hypothetical protein
VKGGKFLKKLKKENDEPTAGSTVQQSYHAHTVVFESPGCKKMLSQMQSTVYLPPNGSSIVLQHLDITSYLSAPNLINTCKRHLGTVCRILTDFSRLSWWNKYIFYLAKTHESDKIECAFKPAVDKPEIEEVIDWPLGKTEHDDFHKWGKSDNNFHPKGMDAVRSEVHKGKPLLRYQTKAYNECARSLSAFTQDQLEFLKSYHWFRDMFKLFELKDCFSVMSNNECQKEAEGNLNSYGIDKVRIHCPEASTLHKLIPYVRRMVRLFPDIKKNLKDEMSKLEMIRRIYQFETDHYVTNIEQSALDFNPDALKLREFFLVTNKFGSYEWLMEMLGQGYPRFIGSSKTHLLRPISPVKVTIPYLN